MPLDLNKLTDAQLDAIAAGDLSVLSDKELDEIIAATEPEEIGYWESMKRGFGATMSGVGRTLGIVDPEEYKADYSLMKESAAQNPIATGLGQAGAVLGGAGAAALSAPLLAPAAPFAGLAMGAFGAGAMMGGEAAARLGPEGENVDPLTRLQGIDLSHDIGVVGVGLPGGVGTSFAQRVGSGVGINVGLGGGQRALERDIVFDDYPQLQPDVFDPTAVGLDIAFGAGAGAISGIGAPKPKLGLAKEGEPTPPTPDPTNIARTPEEAESRDLGAKEIYETYKQNAERQIEYEQYKYEQLEKEKTEGRYPTREAAEERRKAIEAEQADITVRLERLNKGIAEADAKLGETPAVFTNRRSPTEEPTSVRSDEQAVSPEVGAPPVNLDYPVRQGETYVRSEVDRPQVFSSGRDHQQPDTTPNVFRQTRQPAASSTPIENLPEPTFLERQLESTQDAIRSIEDKLGQTQREENTRGVANEMISAEGKTDYLDRPADQESSVQLNSKLSQLRAIEKRIQEDIAKEKGTATTETIELRPLDNMDDIDAGIPMGPERPPVVIKNATKAEESAVRRILDMFGLGKEKMDIDLSDPTLPKGDLGQAGTSPEGRWVVNTKSLEAFKERLAKVYQKYGKELTLTEVAKFEKLFLAAHEVGHVLLYKVLQTDIYKADFEKLLKSYDAWKAKQPNEVGKVVGIQRDRSPKYYEQFPEFFAQMVAREVMLPKAGRAKGPINAFVGKLQQIWDKLAEHFIGKVSKLSPEGKAVTELFSTFINRLVEDNKAQLAKTGQTIWEVNEVKMSNIEAHNVHNKMFSYEGPARGGFGETRQRTEAEQASRLHGIEVALQHVADAKSVVSMASRMDDIGPKGSKSNARLVAMVNKLPLLYTSNMLNLHSKAQIWSKNPVIKYASDAILHTVQKQVMRANDLLNGRIGLGEFTQKAVKGFWTKLARQQAEDSVAIQAKKSSNADFSKVLDILEEGYGKLTYGESLAKYAASMTDQQKALFKALTKMFENLKTMAQENAAALGKKHSIAGIKGWFPAVRQNGDFVVNFYSKGLALVSDFDPKTGKAMYSEIVYSESFRTIEEAEDFLKQWAKQSPEKRGDLITGGVEEKVGRTPEDNAQTAADFLEGFENFVLQVKEQGGNIDQVLKMTEEQKTWLAARGGKLGSHHKFRQNVPGYMGSQMFKNVAERGQAFRDAVFNSVQEYTKTMAKMEIEEKLNLVGKDSELAATHPNLVEMVEDMKIHALNKDREKFQMKGFQRALDSIYTAAVQYSPWMKKHFPEYPAHGVLPSTLGKSAHLFYIQALMSRPAFWVAQGTQFLWTFRSMVADGGSPIDALRASGAATMLMVHQPPDFIKALHYATNTEVFHPSFINDMNDFHLADFLKQGTKSRLIFDIISGEKPATMADTFSRYATFSLLYAHLTHTNPNLKGVDLYNKVIELTNQNMVLYGNQYKAPIFQKMGVAGDILSPLQTFSTAILGNVIGDMKRIYDAPGGKAKLQASMPLMATGLITMLMTGAIGGTFVAEYEILSRAFNWVWEKIFKEKGPAPSIIDTVMMGDNTFSNRVLSHGLISASTYAVSDEGFDIASSQRWQAMYLGVLTGEKTFLEMVPVLKFMWDFGAAGAATVADFAGLNDRSDAEKRSDMLTAVPGGYKVIGDLAAGAANREMLLDRQGNAIKPQTKDDLIAMGLGTQTISAQREKYILRRAEEDFKKTQSKVAHLKERLMDEAFRGNTAGAEKYLQRLAEKYQITPSQVFNFAKQEMIRRNVPKGIIMIMQQNLNPNSKGMEYMEGQGMFEDPEAMGALPLGAENE